VPRSGQDGDDRARAAGWTSDVSSPAPHLLRRARADVPPVRAVVRVVVIVVTSALVLYLAYLLRKPIGWIVIAAFLAVAVSAPVNRLNRYMRRGFAIALTYLGVLLVPVLLGLLIVPPIVREGNQLAEDLPGYVADVRHFVQKNSTLQKLEEDYGITSKLEDQASKLPGKLGGAAGALGKIGVRLVNSLFAALNILILSIFMVSAGPRWIRAIVAMQQPGHRARMERVFSQTSRAVGAYIGGALLQATIAGVSTFIVLEILGVPFAAPLAVLVFFSDLIPLVGATIGAVLVGLVTAFNDFPTTTIIWTIWAIVYQQLENNLIQPRIQSKALNVEGFFVLVAVLFGATLFGVLGALFAIPVAATVQIIIAEYAQYRREVAAEATLEAASQTPVQVRTR
jgi:predicted PurR-regulated permease PerM